MIYRTDANHKDEDLEGVCRGDIKSLKGNSWADYVSFFLHPNDFCLIPMQLTDGIH